MFNEWTANIYMHIAGVLVCVYVVSIPFIYAIVIAIWRIDVETEKSFIFIDPDAYKCYILASTGMKFIIKPSRLT